MPRSRRRRVNDRRRAHEQKAIAQRTLLHAREIEKDRLERGVKAVFRPRAGEVVEGQGGRQYLVEDDGSLERVREGGKQ